MVAVSVIAALYNKGPYIAETLRSVLAQTLPDWELIVVENGSTDDGPAIVRQFTDPRIRLVASPKRGPGAARNFGLQHATGEWILFLDADDLIEPDYLAARLRDAATEPGAVVSAGPWQEFDHNNPASRSTRFPAGWKQPRATLDAVTFAYAPWALHAGLIRRAHLTAERQWDEGRDALPSEDCVFWFRVLDGAALAWSEHPGALYRRNIPGSRDDAVRAARQGFAASTGTFASNLRYLAERHRQPTPAQAGTVIRVLQRLQQTARTADPALAREIQLEIDRWLGATAYGDKRMLLLRLQRGALFRRPVRPATL